MGLVFYYTPMSSASRVYWALEELGVPFEKVKVDLAAGEQRKPEFLALNANGKVPLLVVDGTPVFESLAILIHLAETFGVAKGLYPEPGLARAEALKWMAWGTASLGECASRVLRNTSELFPAEQRNAKAAEAARKDLGDLYSILDDALAGKTYLVGEAFSFADLALASYSRLAQFLGFDLSPFANVRAWTERCTARPSFARAMSAR
jgi:glutathione S-transferase